MLYKGFVFADFDVVELSSALKRDPVSLEMVANQSYQNNWWHCLSHMSQPNDFHSYSEVLNYKWKDQTYGYVLLSGLGLRHY